MKEIYWNTTCDILLVEDLTTGIVNRLDHMRRSFIIETDNRIKDLYPEQYEELCQMTGRECREYGRVYQFLACNFSSKDGHPDIDDDGNFILEKVSCPIRHTCKRNICSPKISGKLSGREIEVIGFFVKGFHEEEIGERLFISKATVHNHVTHIYQKLNLTGSNPDRQLVAYAIKQKLFN